MLALSRRGRFRISPTPASFVDMIEIHQVFALLRGVANVIPDLFVLSGVEWDPGSLSDAA